MSYTILCLILKEFDVTKDLLVVAFFVVRDVIDGDLEVEGDPLLHKS